MSKVLSALLMMTMSCLFFPAQGQGTGSSLPQHRPGGQEKTAALISTIRKTVSDLGYTVDLRKFPHGFKVGDAWGMGNVLEASYGGGKKGPKATTSTLTVYVSAPEEAPNHYAASLAATKKQGFPNGFNREGSGESMRLKDANKIKHSASRDEVSDEALVFKQGTDRFLYAQVRSRDYKYDNGKTMVITKSLNVLYFLVGYSGDVYYELTLGFQHGWRSDGGEGGDVLMYKDAASVKPLKSLEDADLPHFSDLLAFEAALRGGPAPGWGDAPAPKVFVTLEAKASPDALRADGKSRSVINVSVKERAENTNAAPKPKAGAQVGFELVASDGFTAGSLSASQAVTGADGSASITFTAPEREASGKGKIRRAEIAVRTMGVKDERVYVDLLSDEGKVSVSPALEGAAVPTAVIPSDKRFPASIKLYLEDRDMKPKKGDQVVFTLDAKEPRGHLRNKAGATGASVTEETGADGVARVQYIYTGPPVEDQAYAEAITIMSKELPGPLEAGVSVGIKLAISSIKRMADRGTVNAGETVALKISVKDRLHPQVKNLDKLLLPWVGNLDGAPSIGVRLFIRPEGNLPDYLVEQLLLKTWPPEPFKDFVSTRFLEETGETVLWMFSGRDYEGVPRIRPRFTGENYYSLRAYLAESSNDRPVGSKPSGASYLTIKAGQWADAGRIFLVDDPFGEHTPEAKLFRQVLNLAGAGVILDLTEIVTLANKGDVDKLAEIAITKAKDKLTEMVSEKFNAKIDEYLGKFTEYLGEEAVAAYTAVTLVQEAQESAAEVLGNVDETLLAAGYDTAKLAGTKREEAGGRDPFVAKIMDTMKLTKKKLLISTGVELQDKEGNTLPGLDRITVSEKGVVALKKRGLCVYLVPAEMELAPGQNFKEYTSPR